jgi:hypothetical protein
VFHSHFTNINMLNVWRLRASTTTVQARRCLCAKPKPAAPASPLGPEQDYTTLFKATNPELLFDHKKRSSWWVVGGVWAVFGTYIAYVAIYKDRMFDPPAPAAPDLDSEVHKVLPDGRVLLKDGSIRLAPPPPQRKAL